MKHEVSINVIDCKNHKMQVLKNRCTRFPKYLLKLLTGVFCRTFVQIPERIISSVERFEVGQGGAGYGAE